MVVHDNILIRETCFLAGNNKQKWVPLDIEPERRKKGRTKEVAPPPRRQISREDRMDRRSADRPPRAEHMERRERKEGIF